MHEEELLSISFSRKKKWHANYKKRNGLRKWQVFVKVPI